MAVYAIGDIQGCSRPLHQLLAKIGFDPAQDRLWLTGDLVNRGPDSLGVLRFVKDLGDRAVTVLGNHDIHLLAIWAGCVQPRGSDTIQDVLAAPDVDELMHWLRRQPLLHHDPALGYVMTHAGIPAPWTFAEAKQRATEVEAALGGPGYWDFLCEIYGNEPDIWSDALTGIDRLRYIINAFTRMRCCDEQGRLLLNYKGTLENRPPGHLPWFEVPHRRYDGPTIVFGHWSALGYRNTGDVLALDTGCLWGGSLTAVRLDGPLNPVSIDCGGC